MFFIPVLVINLMMGVFASGNLDDNVIEVVDMTHPTTTSAIVDHYGAVEKRWKICINCGIPGLGTAMHLDYEVSSSSAMYPAVIPTEYLVTRLVILDISPLAVLNPALVLSLEVAMQWLALRQDPKEPTIVLFKFGWKSEGVQKMRSCVCKVPGLSYELAEWIAANLTHVVGVATDAPTLESEQTREFNTKTVASILGKSGIYMIENVKVKRRMPDHGCLSVVMPVKLLHTSYVPSRMTAFCAAQAAGNVVLSVRSLATPPRAVPSRRSENRDLDVALDDIMNN